MITTTVISTTTSLSTRKAAQRGQQEELRMTSLDIAEISGKPHNDVLKAIRKMEPAWVEVTGGNFSLSEYLDPTGRKLPCYLLTKTETLYIAERLGDRQQLALPSPQKILAMADNIVGEGLRILNEEAEDTLTATQVAKTFNMTTLDFNAVLRDMGIQYRRHGRWNLSDDLQGRGYTAERTHVSYSLKGEKKIHHYMTWTLEGLRFLNSKLGYPNF